MKVRDIIKLIEKNGWYLNFEVQLFVFRLRLSVRARGIYKFVKTEHHDSNRIKKKADWENQCNRE